MESAKVLRNENAVQFCFIGGGSQFQRVQRFAAAEGLSNIKCLPYQPLNELAGSLSAADLHVVVMGNPFVGLVHPCKIYNVLSIGAPVLYIGPEPAHIPDIFNHLNGRVVSVCAAHGEVAKVVEAIGRVRTATGKGNDERRPATADFSKDSLLPQLVKELEV
jgi:hypothetical protein